MCTDDLKIYYAIFSQANVAFLQADLRSFLQYWARNNRSLNHKSYIAFLEIRLY